MQKGRNLMAAVAVLLIAVASANGQIKDEKIFRLIPGDQRPALIARLRLYIDLTLNPQQDAIRKLYDDETLCSLCLGKKDCVDHCAPPMVADVPNGFTSQIIQLKPISVELVKGQPNEYKIIARQKERVDYYGDGKYRQWKKRVSIKAALQQGGWYFSLITESGGTMIL